MSPSNMISVIVATCFGVFIGLGNTSLLYYAAKVSDSVQGKGIWKVQSLRRSADNVGEMPQLASIPGCQSGGSQEIGRAQNSAILATAELYDPAAGTFTLTGSSMTSMRWFHTATLLAIGKVLLAGGRNNFGSNGYSATAELFDPPQTASPQPDR